MSSAEEQGHADALAAVTQTHGWGHASASSKATQARTRSCRTCSPPARPSRLHRCRRASAFAYLDPPFKSAQNYNAFFEEKDDVGPDSNDFHGT